MILTSDKLEKYCNEIKKVINTLVRCRSSS